MIRKTKKGILLQSSSQSVSGKTGKRLMKGHTKRKKCNPPPRYGVQKPPKAFGGLKIGDSLKFRALLKRI